MWSCGLLPCGEGPAFHRHAFVPRQQRVVGCEHALGPRLVAVRLHGLPVVHSYSRGADLRSIQYVHTCAGMSGAASCRASFAVAKHGLNVQHGCTAESLTSTRLRLAPGPMDLHMQLAQESAWAPCSRQRTSPAFSILLHARWTSDTLVEPTAVEHYARGCQRYVSALECMQISLRS